MHAVLVAEALLEFLEFAVDNDFLERANNHIKVVILFVLSYTVISGN
jgi:hypothetical protein